MKFRNQLATSILTIFDCIQVIPIDIKTIMLVSQSIFFPNNIYPALNVFVFFHPSFYSIYCYNLDRCISYMLRCDGVNNCGNGVDEGNCPREYSSKQILNYRI